MAETAQVLVRHGVDPKTFREEILPAGVPVVLKDLVQDWPSVRAARESPRALVDYIRGMGCAWLHSHHRSGNRILWRKYLVC
jgi:hypothetical protein